MKPYDKWATYVITVILCRKIQHSLAINPMTDRQARMRIMEAADKARIEFNESRKPSVDIDLPFLFSHKGEPVHFRYILFAGDIDDSVLKILFNLIEVMP